MADHVHTPGAERDEDGLWEVDCDDPTCTELVPLRVMASRYTTEAQAREASAAIITMIGDSNDGPADQA